jgi:hypothetical protein
MDCKSNMWHINPNSESSGPGNPNRLLIVLESLQNRVFIVLVTVVALNLKRLRNELALTLRGAEDDDLLP